VAAGRSDEAIAQYQAILKLRPAYAEAHFNLGNALALAGRLGEAAESTRRPSASNRISRRPG